MRKRGPDLEEGKDHIRMAHGRQHTPTPSIANTALSH